MYGFTRRGKWETFYLLELFIIVKIVIENIYIITYYLIYIVLKSYDINDIRKGIVYVAHHLLETIEILYLHISSSFSLNQFL